MINFISSLVSIDGFGSKRIFGIYIGLNQNLSKLLKLIHSLHCVSFTSLTLTSHSSTSSLSSFMIPLIGISISERLRDRGYDIVICFDDLSKHSKSYRQISLILNKIPSRDAFPADIFNVHPSILERCGKIKSSYFGGSITAFPLTETINSDITEYIATNVISITDRQFYTNKRLFFSSIRPAIDSGLSVSRIGSIAQCKSMKVISVGIKNELTNYRIMELTSDKLIALNTTYFQDHLFISTIESTLILLFHYRNGILFSNSFQIHKLLFIIAFDYLYLYYLVFITKSFYPYSLFSLVITFLLYIRKIIYR